MAAVLVGAGIGTPARSEAGIVIDTPAGLNPGDTFRIAFVTVGTRDASSDDITDYNAFVTNDAIAQAGPGGVTYGGVALSWEAIVSTALRQSNPVQGTAAIDNIGVTGASVHLADGTLVSGSDGPAGLWSGSIDHAIDRSLTTITDHSIVWTGADVGGGLSALSLGYAGGGGFYRTGFTSQTNGTWVSFFYGPLGPEALGSTPHAFYAVSQTLTVPAPAAAVPEPASLVLAGLGSVIGLACGRSRRRGRPGRPG